MGKGSVKGLGMGRLTIRSPSALLRIAEEATESQRDEAASGEPLADCLRCAPAREVSTITTQTAKNLFSARSISRSDFR